MPLFCRHNRFEANCPICSKEKRASARPVTASPRARVPTRKPGGGAPRAGGVVTRRLARAADDGYRHELLPGVKATEDAERLAAALALAAAQLDFPGPHPEIVEHEDVEEATRLAFLIVSEADEEDPSPALQHFEAWVARSGSHAAAFTGEPGWTPQRRFARIFDRLAFPGFGREKRFELLNTLGAAGFYELEADALHVGGEDATTLAAKRILNSGDTMLLERRAAQLASATGVPIGALDRAFAWWDGTDPVAAPEDDERLPAIRSALHL